MQAQLLAKATDFQCSALRFEFIKEMERLHPREHYFEDFPFVHEQRIAEINAAGNNVQDPWVIPVCILPGPPRGALYAYDPPSVAADGSKTGGTMVLKYTDVMRIFGMTMCCVELAGATPSAL